MWVVDNMKNMMLLEQLAFSVLVFFHVWTETCWSSQSPFRQTGHHQQSWMAVFKLVYTLKTLDLHVDVFIGHWWFLYTFISTHVFLYTRVYMMVLSILYLYLLCCSFSQQLCPFLCKHIKSFPCMRSHIWPIQVILRSMKTFCKPDSPDIDSVLLFESELNEMSVCVCCHLCLSYIHTQTTSSDAPDLNRMSDKKRERFILMQDI